MSISENSQDQWTLHRDAIFFLDFFEIRLKNLNRFGNKHLTKILETFFDVFILGKKSFFEEKIKKFIRFAYAI